MNYIRNFNMSFRYAVGAANKGKDFEHTNLVDKTAMDAWLESKNAELTEKLQEVFPKVESTVYVFPMDNTKTPGYVEVTTSEKLTGHEMQGIECGIREGLKSFAREFNKQPFTQTEHGFAKLSGTDNNELMAGSPEAEPDFYNQHTILPEARDPFTKIVVTERAVSGKDRDGITCHWHEYTHDIYMDRLSKGDDQPITPDSIKYDADIFFMEDRRVEYSEKEVCATLVATHPIEDIRECAASIWNIERKSQILSLDEALNQLEAENQKNGGIEA